MVPSNTWPIAVDVGVLERSPLPRLMVRLVADCVVPDPLSPINRQVGPVISPSIWILAPSPKAGPWTEARASRAETVNAALGYLIGLIMVVFLSMRLKLKLI